LLHHHQDLLLLRETKDTREVTKEATRELMLAKPAGALAMTKIQNANNGRMQESATKMHSG
jgi:molybdopterin-guanine dinucleotide biosynthesis protein